MKTPPVFFDDGHDGTWLKQALGRSADWWGRVQLDPEDLWIVTAYKIKLTRERSGYQRLRAENRETKTNKALARIVLDAPKGSVVDHINGDIFDNRKSNLRLCSRAENSRNGRARGGVSRFVGVCRVGKKWQASVTVDGTHHYLGLFSDEISAAKMRDDAARRLHGEFAALNFPAQGEQTAHRPRASQVPMLASGTEALPPAGTSDGGITGHDTSRMAGTGEITEDACGCLSQRDATAASVSFPFHAGETSDA